ncbi:MAG: hypothetical protein J6C41_02225 [Oscillospiraceae bacterium]|nr:hypothetical protein [Oscillospiraceae bacterium]
MVKFQDRLIAEGYCDNRGAGFCASAAKLPNGEYGLVLLCVNGNNLNLFDIDIKSNIGELLYVVELKKIENLKIRAGILSPVLRFDYNGYTYSFKNFVGVKPALKVIEEEAGNR